MIQQIEQLCAETDGRFATDGELKFLESYLKTARLRFALYQKLQKLESQIVQQVLAELQSKEPDLLIVQGKDMTAKWQRDTVRVLRYAAAALLTDDAEIFKDRMLMWFQTIMKSFHAERSCEATYQAMRRVLQDTLTPVEAAVFCPLIEMSRVTLGISRR